jgi:two-component system sensor histidine kinase QseC
MGSIRNRLLGMLLATTTLTWVGAGLWTYQGAHHGVDELLDAQLAQSARLLLAQAGHERPASDGDDDDDDEEDEHAWERRGSDLRLERRVHFQAWDSAGRLLYRSSSHAPRTPLAAQRTGFSDATVDGDRWRVFSLWDAAERINLQVGQEHRVREELAIKLVLRSLIPNVVGLLCTLLVMGWTVNRALKPLQRVAREVSLRTGDNLAPLAPLPVPTEVEPLSRALDALLARIQVMLSNERQFTSNAAHELRTPLAAIKAHAQVARQSTLDGERTHALDQLVRGVDRATHVVEQLLTLARLDPQGPAEKMVPVDVHAVARDVLADLAPVALANGAELALEGEPGAWVLGDATLLGTLLRNLVDNAVKYGPRGGTVTVHVTVDGKQVLLAVDDAGPGIAPQDRTRVFERFHRQAGTDVTGSGLGLSIVKRVAELMRATVTLENGPGGRGLRAAVRFPRTDAAAQTPARP